VSEGKRASLDLGPAADVGPDVHENRARVARAAGLPLERLALAEQVHGTTVVRARPGTLPVADALWTDAQDAWIGIRTADCVPVLLSSEDGARVAAVHSGWRGTAARIAGAAVATLAREGVRPQALRAAIERSIGPCCYEVSEDLAGRFADAFGAEVVRRNGPRPHLDLRLAVRRTLVQAGVPETHIEDVPVQRLRSPALLLAPQGPGWDGAAPGVRRARPRFLTPLEAGPYTPHGIPVFPCLAFPPRTS
jgi:YfiH family protein